METLHSQQAVDREALLSVLQYEACRDTLSQLPAGPDTVTSLDVLASDSGDRTTGGTGVTAVRLHHVTLPRLADAGLVDCDPETKTVRSNLPENPEQRSDPLLDGGR